MIKRRHFVKLMSLGSAGLGMGLVKTGDTQLVPPTAKISSYRQLGKTGLKISDIGGGTINFHNPNVFRYAFDCGVNHFDTAEAYGNSESSLPRALKDIRKEIVLTSKYLLRNSGDFNRSVLIKRVEASLKRLQTDYLDVAMVHSVDEPENIAHPEVMAAFTQLKKTGKVRFIGFSTHQADKLLPKAMELGLWEVVLMIYNHMEGPKVEPLIDQARKQGIGLIAMKVFAGGMQGDLKKLVNGKQRYSQAAIRWVLGNPNIDACIVTLSTFSHVEEYLAASGSPLKHGDKKLLSQYHQNFDRHYCRVSCSECLSSCPYGVEVNSILRYGMYYRYYGMEKTAIQLYKDTNPLKKAFACYGCTGPCRKRCPYELAVQEKLIQCHQLLRV